VLGVFVTVVILAVLASELWTTRPRRSAETSLPFPICGHRAIASGSNGAVATIDAQTSDETCSFGGDHVIRQESMSNLGHRALESRAGHHAAVLHDCHDAAFRLETSCSPAACDLGAAYVPPAFRAG
jgi:hypothetical protein